MLQENMSSMKPWWIHKSHLLQEFRSECQFLNNFARREQMALEIFQNSSRILLPSATLTKFCQEKLTINFNLLSYIIVFFHFFRPEFHSKKQLVLPIDFSIMNEVDCRLDSKKNWATVKFKYCEKATKIWKNLPF